MINVITVYIFNNAPSKPFSTHIHIPIKYQRAFNFYR